MATTARIEQRDRDAAVRLAVRLTSAADRKLNISDVLGAAIEVAARHENEMVEVLKKLS